MRSAGVEERARTRSGGVRHAHVTRMQAWRRGVVPAYMRAREAGGVPFANGPNFHHTEW